VPVAAKTAEFMV